MRLDTQLEKQHPSSYMTCIYFPDGNVNAVKADTVHFNTIFLDLFQMRYKNSVAVHVHSVKPSATPLRAAVTWHLCVYVHLC